MRRCLPPFLPLVLALALAALSRAQEKYPERFDHIDLDAILANERLVSNYVKCFLKDGDEGCTQEGREVKRVLSDAVSTDCTKCTERQLQRITKVTHFLYKNRRSDWERLQNKYDPGGEYVKKHPELVE